jgi:1-acyl-sn-glycerol-3-phosphate acyltransferase
VPVVPARLGGLFALKQAGKRHAPPGQITISLGSPMSINTTRPAEEIAREIQEQVTVLGAS